MQKKPEKDLQITSQTDWDQLETAFYEVKRRREQQELPITCYYYKAGELIGSFACNDEEGDIVLFFNMDYFYDSVLLQLIIKHCQFFNEEIPVYPLRMRGIALYETLTPKTYLTINL